MIVTLSVNERAPGRTASGQYSAGGFKCSEAFTVIGGTEAISD